MVAPVVTVDSTSSTIKLYWTSPGPVVDSYEVVWMKNNLGNCPNVDMGGVNITDGSTSYYITGLEEDSIYIITVTATNAAGSAVSDSVNATTHEAGETQCSVV